MTKKNFLKLKVFKNSMNLFSISRKTCISKISILHTQRYIVFVDILL